MGRAYGSPWPLPCLEHLDADMAAEASREVPVWQGRRARLRQVMSIVQVLRICVFPYKIKL